ncbi:transcription factor IIA alpha/beta subunit [Mycena latifolia]|nr:transcription factor IIA alpha/beta subunit [Mycena latifolia]
MSNKIVPGIYRSVIDDVIAAIRPAFDEFGVADDILDELQHKWETKVIASRVADFEPAQPAQAHHPYPAPTAAAALGVLTAALAHASARPPASASASTSAASVVGGLPPYAAYVPPSAPRVPGGVTVKTEPVDLRGVGGGAGGLADARYAAYALPPLPGPQLGIGSGFPAFPASLQHAGLYRLPQTDGPSASSASSDEDDEPAGARAYPPRPAHPSLAPPPAPTPTQQEADDSAITSDLDDSDTENEDDAADAEGGPETDIVFCTYDKVVRVKNRWKCVLKDGVVHSGGKDYLFNRCTGEFEW